uniref:Uncharacterized protein n=1 Tax=Podospora anserina (strain S / ATCC MYA-4624 / DSM 980 / FGSC 10383) TaxID=515849 RepID=A0A090CVD2_PODAN|nr:Putative protein of unknown function [Podospora anserina S mat+]
MRRIGDTLWVLEELDMPFVCRKKASEERNVVTLVTASLFITGAPGPMLAIHASTSTATSQYPSYWKIDDLVLKVYDWDNGGSKGTFGFTSYSLATNRTVEYLAQDVDLAKLQWSQCSDPGVEFQFDFDDMSLSLRETWTCSGSPEIMFNANATGLMMLHGCLDSDTEKGVESDCHVMEFGMAADVTSSGMA